MVDLSTPANLSAPTQGLASVLGEATKVRPDNSHPFTRVAAQEFALQRQEAKLAAEAKKQQESLKQAFLNRINTGKFNSIYAPKVQQMVANWASSPATSDDMVKYDLRNNIDKAQLYNDNYEANLKGLQTGTHVAPKELSDAILKRDPVAIDKYIKNNPSYSHYAQTDNEGNVVLALPQKYDEATASNQDKAELRHSGARLVIGKEQFDPFNKYQIVTTDDPVVNEQVKTRLNSPYFIDNYLINHQKEVRALQNAAPKNSPIDDATAVAQLYKQSLLPALVGERKLTNESTINQQPTLNGWGDKKAYSYTYNESNPNMFYIHPDGKNPDQSLTINGSKIPSAISVQEVERNTDGTVTVKGESNVKGFKIPNEATLSKGAYINIFRPSQLTVSRLFPSSQSAPAKTEVKKENNQSIIVKGKVR